MDLNHIRRQVERYQGRVVKGTSFTDLRDAGDPVEMAANHFGVKPILRVS